MSGQIHVPPVPGLWGVYPVTIVRERANHSDGASLKIKVVSLQAEGFSETNAGSRQQQKQWIETSRACVRGFQEKIELF